MKKILLLTKTLLAAVLLCVGQNAWGGEITTLYGRAVSDDLEHGYTAWSASDIGSGKWVDANGVGSITANGLNAALKSAGGSRSLINSSITSPSANAILIYDIVWDNGSSYGNNGSYCYLQVGSNIYFKAYSQAQKGEVVIGENVINIPNACIKNQNRDGDVWTIHMEINTASSSVTALTIAGNKGTTKVNYTLSSATSYGSATFTSLTLGWNRAASADFSTTLQSVRIQEEAQDVETADYNINYKDGETTVKTVSGNVAVGTEIDVLSSFWVSTTKYVKNGGEPSSLTVAKGGSNLDVAVSEATQYTCTVNAKAGETLLASPSGTVYSGENVKVFYKKAYKNGGIWYMTPANGSYPSYAHNFSAVAANSNYDVTTYSAAENVVYFGEVEEMNLSGSFAADGGQTDRYSNGVAKRLYSKGGGTPSGGSWVYTDDIPAGVYTVTMWARNQSSSQTATLPVYLRDSEGNMTDLSTSFEAWAKSAQGEKSVEITIPNDGKTYSVAIYNYSGYNSNLEMDYVYVTFVRPLSVSKTITAARYATFCSPYALNFEGVSGLKAYIVKGTVDETTELNLEEVTSVPANEGVLLEGDAGEYNIPVVASADPVSGNKLEGVIASDVLTAKDGYVLMGSPKVGFYLNNNDFTLTANTAYLPANFAEAGDGARSAYFFRGDITAVEAVEAAVEAKAQEGKFIENGKLVIVKNGVKYNAAGQQVK